VRVPPEAGSGKARVTLSFPGLESMGVEKRVVEIDVEQGPSRGAKVHDGG